MCSKKFMITKASSRRPFSGGETGMAKREEYNEALSRKESIGVRQSSVDHSRFSFNPKK